MADITNDNIIQKLTDVFGTDVTAIEQPFGLLTFEANTSKIIEILQFLKEDSLLSFNFLTDITAVHYPEKEKQLAIVYHLHSFKHNIRVRVKAFTSVINPTIASATVLWDGANWMERETYDFFGISFLGHPDLRRILNVDDMEVFPMRKEYPLEDPNRIDKKDYFFGR